MQSKPAFEMALADLRRVQPLPWNARLAFDGLVILPTGRRHRSGYRCMDFVPLDRAGIPLGRWSGASDVLHVGGIVPEVGSVGVAWSIDCLPCGALCLFCGRPMQNGLAVSSFEVRALLSPFSVEATNG